MIRRTLVVVFHQKKSVVFDQKKSLVFDQKKSLPKKLKSSSFYSSRSRSQPPPRISSTCSFSFDSFSSACGLDSIEVELDFIFTSNSDSKQLILDKDIWWARCHFTGPGWTYLVLKVDRPYRPDFWREI
ncbi:unnamed protein product [Microthlaspi erraticum]|uniref:Uncharacterized protein n=1 Tax=Microthlaspi erraticum TaxID=1685480 RepID=A0A6D2LGE1_9BRAS|nr:unnamed protein product [Microthlaspi erraticum]